MKLSGIFNRKITPALHLPVPHLPVLHLPTKKSLSASLHDRYVLTGIYGAVTGGGLAVSGAGIALIGGIAVAPVVVAGATVAAGAVGAYTCVRIIKDLDRIQH